MYKKYLAILVSLVMVFSAVPVRVAADPVAPSGTSRTLVLQQGHVPLVDAERNDTIFDATGVPNAALFDGTPLGSTSYAGTIDVGSIMQRDGAPASNNGFLFASPMAQLLQSHASDAAWLMYFDVASIIPEASDATATIVIEDVAIYLHVSNGPNNVGVSVHRVVDDNNMASYLEASGPGWVSGTHDDTNANVTLMNNGVSWFFRDNGFNNATSAANTGDARSVAPDRQRVGWTALNDALPIPQGTLPTLRDSVLPTPSASTNVTSPLNRWVSITGTGLAADVQA